MEAERKPEFCSFPVLLGTLSDFFVCKICCYCFDLTEISKVFYGYILNVKQCILESYDLK